jgi:hypothetical protein
MAVNGKTVSEIGDVLFIKLSTPYKKVKQVLDYTDSVDNEDTINYFEKQFRWSSNNVSYSDWIDLTSENLEKIILDPSKDFWIQYKYEVQNIISGETMTFNSISLEIITEEGTIFDVTQISCTDAATQDDCYSNLLIENDCNDTFKPYDLSRAQKNYNQLSLLTSNIFGHDANYFKVIPKESSLDVILKEFSIYEGKTAQCIKILFPDNQFPTQEDYFNPYEGVALPSQFEIHISRSEYQSKFGENSKPEEFDFLYIPVLDKWYEITSVTLPDDFFNESTYFRVMLDKWSDRKMIDYQNSEESEEMREYIDNSIDTQEEIFGELVEDEYEKVRKDIQYNTVKTGIEDNIREAINTTLVISPYKIKNNSTVISKYYYDLSKITSGTVAVVYRHEDIISSASNRSLTFWINPKFITPKGSNFLVNNIVNNNGNPQFQLTEDHGYEVGDYIKIKGHSNYKDVYRILSKSSTSFTLNCEYVNGIEDNVKTEKREVLDVIEFGNNDMSFNITIDYVMVKIGDNDYSFNLGFELTNSEWYGFVFNVSNEFKQLSTFIHQIDQSTVSNNENETTKLNNIYDSTIYIEEFSFSKSDWKLNKSQTLLTNFRLFEKGIEVEEQSLILNQYIVKDTHLSLIVDNALPQLRLASVSRPQ